MLQGTTFAILNMFVLVTGMFMIHSVLSAHLNHVSDKRKGIVNGLYISFYYAGGALGSWFPAMIYSQFGWEWFILFLALVCAVGIFFTYRLTKTTT
jgi:YNFM family putative membrane transporter